MKKIYLAPKGKRILARFIDFIILVVSTAVLYLAAVYPNGFNPKAYNDIYKQAATLYDESSLYLVLDDGSWDTKAHYTNDIKTLKSLTSVILIFKGKVFDNNNLSKDLYTYYTTQHGRFSGDANFTLEAYQNSILQVGKEESNIASFDPETYEITLIDESKESTTVTYFLKVYYTAALVVDNSDITAQYKDAANKLVINALLLIIPVFVGFSLIYDGLIPVFSKYGQTIGKYIFHLIVLTDEGHRVPKIKQLLRWLVYILELAFGIATFGGGILIPYTMFLFTKKRQALHDMAAKTVVVDGDRSIFFETKKEEAYYINRMKEKENGQADLSGTSGEE